MNNHRFMVASLLLIALGTAGCSPLVMTREARNVVVTDTAPDFNLCKPRGVVFALAPFSSPEQPLEQLKIRASGIGADTVVLVRDSKTPTDDWSGKAYRCGSALERPSPQPSEVQAERKPK